jgi:tetratricopeptide (TPR) repeat protein
MQRVLTVARAENDPHLMAVPASVIGRTFIVQGQFAQAVSVLSDAIAALEQVRDEVEWIMAVGMRGIAYTMRGNYALGMAEGERALARAEQANTLTGVALGHGLLGQAHLFGGNLPLALQHLRAMIETAAQSGDRLHAYMGHGFLAWTLVRAGNLAEAETNFDQAQAIAQAIGGRLVFSDWLTAARAERAMQSGDFALAIELAQIVIAQADESKGLCSAGIAQRVWGQAMAKQNPADWASAEIHFATSIQKLESGDACLEAARTHVAWGNLLRERGDIQSAHAHLNQAATQYQASGLTWELNAIRDL